MASFSSILLVASSAYLCLALLGMAWGRTPVSRWFAVSVLLAAVCALAYERELSATGLDEKVFWLRVRAPFLLLLPSAWLAMVQHYVGGPRWLERRAWTLLVLFHVAGVVLALTEDAHGLYRHDFRLETVGAFRVLVFRRGPASVAQLLVNYLQSLGSLALLGRAWWSAPATERRRLGLVFFAYALPLTADALWLCGFSPLPGINLWVFALLLTGAVWVWALFRYRVLDLVPLARGMVLDHLPSLVLVQDPRGRLADINKVAQERLGLEPHHALGLPLAQTLPAAWMPLVTDATPGRVSQPVPVPLAQGTAWFERSVIAVRDRGMEAGTLVIAQDVTDRVRAERSRDEERQLLALVADAIAEAVILHDEDGRILSVNQPMLEMFGLTRDQAHAADILAELSGAGVDAAGVRAAWKSLQPGEKRSFQWTSRRPATGELFESTVFVHGVTRHGCKLVVATVADVSQRRAQERAALEVQRLQEERRYHHQLELLVRDLHDGIGGIAANIGMMAVLGQQAPTGAGKDAVLGRIASLAAEGSTEVRSLMNTLESRELRWADLLVDLRRSGTLLLEEHGIAFSLALDGAADEPGPGLYPGISLLRIFKEALHNVAKHAGATAVDVRLRFQPGELLLGIRDNGRGLPPSRRPGRGLRNMEQRARDLGGTMALSGPPGVVLEFRFPLPLNSPAMGMDGVPPPGT